MYPVRILPAASRELERIDKSIGRRIVDRINWLAGNLDVIQPAALTGDLMGLYKLRHLNQFSIYAFLYFEIGL